MKIENQLYAFTIQPQEVDFQQKATLATIGNILLTAAGYNADDCGFGSRKLNEIQCTWVLTKMAIEMAMFPLQYEEIKVKTWVEDASSLSTTRNFTIYNKDNDIIGYASSNWVMLDIATRRPKRLDLLEGLENAVIPENCPIEKPVKLTAINGKLLDSFKTKYSDIDINKHTNSVRYIEWISNCFHLDMYKERNISRFEINYITEILFDDVVNIFREEIKPNDFRFEIQKEGKAACKARMVWK